ncbi:MAG TPA: NAD-dependent epimerase/dehydratase family protein [Dokdonella sp.]|uniref:NAD-dependent epimerase/dehydratase family protein n=1 Tax=Dokdonella sp. TaxID=2291710 RepID=UPI002CCC81D0|nr:NAD-dependent epimerase/dehydratase family protein [Dokdonella sp.]HUD42064.1 NAD-dependent epimerase/dehydratase family protein [Dokdonella sp.]
MPLAFVAGADGQIGRFLVPRLLDAGWHVIALSRRPRPPSQRPGLQWRCGDLYGAMPALPAIDALFSLGPLDGLAGWLPSAKTGGIGRIVAFGSMSAESKRASPDPAERALAARLAASEQALATAAASLGAGWTVLRPTLIYGAGMDHSLTPIARLARRLRVFPRLLGGEGLRQPVHAADLAGACLSAMTHGHAAGRVYALGGGERLPFAAMLERVRAGLGVATLPLPVPLALLRVGGALWRTSPGMPRLAAIVERLSADLIADDAAAAADLGWSPRPFRPDPACWSPPPAL